MTPAQARQKLRSLLYRSRLAEKLPKIEAELIAFLQLQGPQVLDRDLVDVEDGRLSWEKLPTREFEQLQLFEELKEV